MSGNLCCRCCSFFTCIGIGSFFGLGFLARRGIWRFAWDGDMDIGIGSLELGFWGGLRVEK